MNDFTTLGEMNGHPLRVMRCKHNLTLQGLAEATRTSVTTIWRAENDYPIGAESRYRLCAYFHMTSQELGLVERVKKGQRIQRPISIAEPQPLHNISSENTVVASRSEQEAPVIIFKQGQALDALLNRDEQPLPEQQLGAWLALEACNLGSLFDAGWTLEAILESLRLVLQGVQGMPRLTRRRLLQLGSAAVVSGINIPMKERVSEEERMQLTRSLDEGIATGWKLCHTADSSQVLVVGETQLFLLQQCHSMLTSRERAIFYTSVYNLIAEVLHFQGRLYEALEMHVNAQVAAMATGNPLYIAQSIICQSSCYQTLHQYDKAIEATEEALNIIGDSKDEAFIRAKAHFFACWADYAISKGEYAIAQNQIDASAALLDHLQPGEEFDRNSWLQLVGKYAFATRNYTTAVKYLEQAFIELPSDWIVRQVLVLLPLIATRAWMGDKEGSIATMEKAISAVRVLNAPVFGQPLLTALPGLLSAFPKDPQIHKFVHDTQYLIPGFSIKKAANA